VANGWLRLFNSTDGVLLNVNPEADSVRASITSRAQAARRVQRRGEGV
jgi:hypothetical protein